MLYSITFRYTFFFKKIDTLNLEKETQKFYMKELTINEKSIIYGVLNVVWLLQQVVLEIIEQFLLFSELQTHAIYTNI